MLWAQQDNVQGLQPQHYLVMVDAVDIIQDQMLLEAKIINLELLGFVNLGKENSNVMQCKK